MKKSDDSKYISMASRIDQDGGVESQTIAIVREGNLEMLQNLVESTSGSNEESALMWLLENVAFYFTALDGKLDILKYLIELILGSKEKRMISDRIREEASLIAAECGHLDIVKYLDEIESASYEEAMLKYKAQKKVFIIAAKNGHLDILRYLWRLVRFRSSTVVAAYKEAISDGRIEVARYLLSLAQGLKLEGDILSLDLPGLNIETAESLLRVVTPNQAVVLAEHNITPSLALQAIEGKAMYTLWYCLDCEASQIILQQIRLRGRHRVSMPMYCSVILAVGPWIQPTDPTILPSLYQNTPFIVMGDAARSLLILDRMLSPIARLYSVCKIRDQFIIFNKLPLELMSDILWRNIFEGIENLLPNKEHYLNVLGHIIVFYSKIRDEQIVIELDNSISEYNLAYTLSFLCNLKNYIKGHNEKTL